MHPKTVGLALLSCTVSNDIITARLAWGRPGSIRVAVCDVFFWLQWFLNTCLIEYLLHGYKQCIVCNCMYLGLKTFVSITEIHQNFFLFVICIRNINFFFTADTVKYRTPYLHDFV